MENSFQRHSKKKQFGKTNCLTGVESLKTPNIRRKSLGTVLPSPKASKKSLDINRRKSIDSEEITKQSKKRKVSGISTHTPIGVLAIHNEGNEKQIRHSLKNVPSPTPEKADKKRLSVNKPLTTLHSKKVKKNIQSNKLTTLVLASRENKDPSRTSEQTVKKTPKHKNLKLHEERSESKKKIEDHEKKFGIKSEDVANALKGVIQFASNNPHLQNQLFNEEIPLFIQINSFKIPKTKGPVKQLFRVPLPHSILPSEPDICLIVPDVKGVKNSEHEQHLEYYENLLRSKNVTGIKKIMTFHEFRTEYDTFELKNRLVDLYDAFLVDGKISGKVVKKCGSIFYKKRKVPFSIKLYLPKLQSHIEKAIKRAYFHLNVRSDSHTIQIGHSKNNTEDLIENVYSVIEFLNTQFPGKIENIRSLNVYAHRGSSIPIYVSLKNPNEIKVPTLFNKKPKAYKSFSGELTTQYNAEVVVRPSGQVIVKRKKTHTKQKGQNPDEDITDAEILGENKRIDKMEEQNGDGTSNNKKGDKKRKLSELAKDQQVNNPGTKKIKKDNKLTNVTVNQEGIHQSAEKRKTDKTMQTVKKQSKTISTPIKKVGKGDKATKQNMFINKNKKKLIS